FFICSQFLFSQNWQSYPYAPANSVLNFPSDDGKHTGTATTTEWWYLNLHLVGSAPGFKKYDVMLCYFAKPAVMRIFNVSTPGNGVFHTDVNQTPLVLTEQTGHWELNYTILPSINDYSKWTYPTDNKTFSYVFHAVSTTNNDALDITLNGNRPPLVVGGNGFIAIGEHGDSSFYYSNTNMKVQGSIKFSGVKDSISSGIGWIDRQYGPFTVGTNANNYYEWYSIQMDKPNATLGTPQTPSEFNVWQIFNDTNSIPFDAASRMVSGIFPDGAQDTSSTYIWERTGYWHDAVNNKYYSQGWRFINPAKGLNLDMTPSIANQVINVTLFKFWEGGTTLKGTIGNQPVDGVGFAELVAGHNTMINVPSVPAGLAVTAYSDHNALSWSASTAGSYPIGGYRIFRSPTNDGHWEYIASTSNLTYHDFSANTTNGYYYTATSFDSQSAKSASSYATAVWVDPFGTGVNSIFRENNSIRIFPNPAGNQTNIYIADYSAKNKTTLELLSVDGKLLKSISVQDKTTVLDISELSSGIYILKVTDNNGVVVRKISKK
ncbi:MAG TPA: T9SS type A sorting domain-containing protein, partial [Bacteroidia bacterium]